MSQDISVVIEEAAVLFAGARLVAVVTENGRIMLHFDNGYKLDTHSNRIGYMLSGVSAGD